MNLILKQHILRISLFCIFVNLIYQNNNDCNFVNTLLHFQYLCVCVDCFVCHYFFLSRVFEFMQPPKDQRGTIFVKEDPSSRLVSRAVFNEFHCMCMGILKSKLTLKLIVLREADINCTFLLEAYHLLTVEQCSKVFT